MNKRDFFSQLQVVRNILLHDWDPIGVGDDLMAKNEYDTYAFDIYQMIENGKSSSDLLNYLIQAEQGRMGLTPNIEHTQSIANKLYALADQKK